MADLRILDAQQRESEQKLHHAKVTKQRRLEQQTALEEQLDKCKYQNGELGAELQRSHELLSDGQLQLNGARNASIKAGDDLREYDEKVNDALDIKSSILAHQRTQEIWLNELRRKAVISDDISKKAELEYNAGNERLQQAKQFANTLRSSIQHEILAQQRIIEQTNKLSSDDTTNKLDCLLSMEEKLVKQLDDKEKDLAGMKNRHHQLFENLNYRQKEYDMKQLGYVKEHEDLTRSIKEKNGDNLQLWIETIDCQKFEGHQSCPKPSESDTPPVLDLSLIALSRNIEFDAVQTETKAKAVIDESIQELTKHVFDLQFCHDKNLSEIDEIRAVNAKSDQIEKDRTLSIENFQSSFEQVLEDIDVQDSRIQVLRLNQRIETENLARIFDGLSTDIMSVDTSHKNISDEKRALNDEINLMQLKCEQQKGSDDTELLRMHNKLDGIRCNIVKLQKEANEDLKPNTDRFGNVVVDVHEQRTQVDEAQKKINAILQGR
jgi:hypothetical protein